MSVVGPSRIFEMTHCSSIPANLRSYRSNASDNLEGSKAEVARARNGRVRQCYGAACNGPGTRPRPRGVRCGPFMANPTVRQYADRLQSEMIKRRLKHSPIE